MEGGKENGARMKEEKLPSEIYSEIKHELKDKQKKLSESAEKLGYAHELISDSEPVWQGLDDIFKSGKPDEVANSSYQILRDYDNQIKAVNPLSDKLTHQINSISGTAIFISDATAGTASFVNWPENYALPNIDKVRNKRQTFEEHENYALMIDRIDQSLGETFRSIKSAYFGSTHDNVRMAIEQARQTWDHLIKKLVRDEEVRTQPWWPNWHPDPKDPQIVTRAQRMRLAAEKYVEDPYQKNVLISGASHTIEVYKRLQKLHTPGPLNETKEKDALFEMVSIIKKWIDSINWELFHRT